MSSRHFESYEVGDAAAALAKLFDEVARFKGRIEFTRGGAGERCVLISKSELDSMESALAILSDTDGVRAMSAQIAQLAAVVEPAAAV